MQVAGKSQARVSSTQAKVSCLLMTRMCHGPGPFVPLRVELLACPPLPGESCACTQSKGRVLQGSHLLLGATDDAQQFPNAECTQRFAGTASLEGIRSIPERFISQQLGGGVTTRG